jgi:hypothetical protein
MVLNNAISITNIVQIINKNYVVNEIEKLNSQHFQKKKLLKIFKIIKNYRLFSHVS